MALTMLCPELADLPSHIPVDYEWDEWQVQSYFFFAEDELFARLGELTGRANIALALAVCEWIAARLRPFSGQTDLDDYLEAGWAALLDADHLERVALPYSDWPGPVLGPQLISIGIINDAYFESDDDPEMQWRSCYAINLARYVLPDSLVFESWLERSIQRLFQFHTWLKEGSIKEDIFAEDFYQGKSVGREIFNHSVEYDPDLAWRSLQRLADNIDPDNEYFFHLIDDSEN